MNATAFIFSGVIILVIFVLTSLSKSKRNVLARQKFIENAKEHGRVAIATIAEVTDNRSWNQKRWYSDADRERYENISPIILKDASYETAFTIKYEYEVAGKKYYFSHCATEVDVEIWLVKGKSSQIHESFTVYYAEGHPEITSDNFIKRRNGCLIVLLIFLGFIALYTIIVKIMGVPFFVY